MLQVIALVVPLFALILLGYLAGRWRPLPIEGLAWLNFFILYAALPALFFHLLATTPMEQFANGAYLASTTLGTFLVFALCFLIARWLRRATVQESTIQGFAGAYGNIGYLGPALAIAAFGPAAGVPVALIFCLDNAMHFTLAPLLMAIGRQEKQTRARLLQGIVTRIFTHPFIIATLAGILAATFRYQPPAAIDTLLASLADAAAPCALFAMGVTAALKPLKRVPVDLAYLVPIKLLVHPMIMYALVIQVPHVDPLWVNVAVLMAALPSATNVFVLAQQYQVWEQRASSAVVLSTAVSTVTLTSFLYWAGAGG